MAFKSLTVLLLACTATAVLGAAAPDSAPLEKRGMISDLMDFTGSLTKTAVDKAVSGGHMGVDLAQSMINMGADGLKSASSYLLRRDSVMPDMSSTINNMIADSQSKLDSSWRQINQIARNQRNRLPEHGRELLDMYMNELKTSRDHYLNGLQNGALSAADLSSMMNMDPNQWEAVQNNYSVEMLDYVNQVRRLGRVLNNNGFSGYEM